MLRKQAAICAAALLSAAGVSRGVIIQEQITSDPGDREVAQGSTGDYSTRQPTVNVLRVGFQSNFGSTGQAFGGIAAVWFFKLPQLNLAAGDFVESADFATTLLEETASQSVTPRFNADLYALGFTTVANITPDATTFFAGQDQTGPGLGAGQLIQKVDDDFFNIFTDFQEVNNAFPKQPKPKFIDEAGKEALRAYIQGIYTNPNFPNTGNEYLVLRLNPDRAPFEQYEENGQQFFFGNGTSRYRVASSESSTLVSNANVDYSQVIPPRLTLNLNVPEPAAMSLAMVGAMLLGMGRRRS